MFKKLSKARSDKAQNINSEVLIKTKYHNLKNEKNISLPYTFSCAYLQNYYKDMLYLEKNSLKTILLTDLGCNTNNGGVLG